MTQGIVKWFNYEKGYGFIETTGYSHIFVHFSQIVTDGFKTLEEGEPVEFELVPNDRFSFEAKNVIRLAYLDKEGNPTVKHDSKSIIEFLKFERENLLRIIGDNYNEFNNGRIYAMDKMIDGLECIYNNL